MLQGLGKVFPHIIASFLLNPFTLVSARGDLPILL